MLSGYKTYITAALTVVGTALSYFSGQVTLEQGIQLALTAIFAAFIRHGVTTAAAA